MKTTKWAAVLLAVMACGGDSTTDPEQLTLAGTWNGDWISWADPTGGNLEQESNTGRLVIPQSQITGGRFSGDYGIDLCTAGCEGTIEGKVTDESPNRLHLEEISFTPSDTEESWEELTGCEVLPNSANAPRAGYHGAVDNNSVLFITAHWNARCGAVTVWFSRSFRSPGF